jgi:hypothetical protein
MLRASQLALRGFLRKHYEDVGGGTGTTPRPDQDDYEEYRGAITVWATKCRAAGLIGDDVPILPKRYPTDIAMREYARQTGGEPEGWKLKYSAAWTVEDEISDDEESSHASPISRLDERDLGDSGRGNSEQRTVVDEGEYEDEGEDAGGTEDEDKNEDEDEDGYISEGMSVTGPGSGEEELADIDD